MDNFDLRNFLAEEKLYEETEALDRESVVDFAQMVADAFTQEDANDAAMIYTVGKVDGLGFELDTQATENTPADAAKYGTGEGWGGSFRIDVKPNGYEIRNSEKGGLVATMDMEDGFKILSADESRAEMGLEENKEEIKSNKMKKSELKEMIKSAFLGETSVEETLVDADQDMAEAILNALGGEAAFEAVVRAMSTDDAQTYLGAIMRDHDIEMGPVGDIPGFEGTMDALDSLSLREEEEDEEDVDVDVEDVDVDVDIDADVDDEGGMDVEDDAKVELTGDKAAVSDNLEAALEAARELGDEKLVDQIGNTITFFTRAHIVKEADVVKDEAEMELEEGELKEDVSSKFIQKYLSMDPPEGIEDIESYSDRDKAILTYLEVGPGVTISDKVAKAIKDKSGADIIKYFQDNDYSYMPYSQMRKVLGVPAVTGFTFDESGSEDADKWYLNSTSNRRLNKIFRTKYPELNIPDIDFEVKFDTTEELNDYFRGLARDQKGQDLEVTYEEYAENYVQFLKDKGIFSSEENLNESVIFPMWNKIK